MEENLDEYAFGELLKTLRKRQKGLTQEALAAMLGITRRSTITDWERGEYIPGRSHLQELIRILGLNEEDTQRLLRASVQNTDTLLVKNTQDNHTLPTLFNIPSLRNPYFTGRKQLLHQLQRVLTEQRAVALVQAISGLGGIGKTQTALEYVYRFQQNYQAILWLNASSQETLFSDIVTLARLLDLPEKESREQEEILVAVKRWLKEHTNWLLIFDNADDVLLVQDFLPAGAIGHVLLTTRNQLVTPVAVSLGIDIMNAWEGSFLLLRRCGLLETHRQFTHLSQETRTVAQRIVDELGRLPLALDQAGAYIQETGCTLSRYLTMYQEQHTSLLKHESQASPHYSETVATTWSISFQRVQRTNSLAAELLMLCAFLQPDAIPEALLLEGVQHLSSPLEPLERDRDVFDEAVKDLRRFSLLHRNPETKTLRIHRLVQVVLKDTLDKTTYRQWAERAVLATNTAFPHAEHSTWSQCEHLLPHALLVTQYIEQYQVICEETGRLLHEMATYLWYRAHYVEAEPLYQRALAIREQQLGPDHLDVATSLNGLANLYHQQGKYVEAEPLIKRALAIREQQLGPDHHRLADSLNNLALLYYEQGKFAQAEPFFQRALAIREQQLGPDHPDVAASLFNLALLYREQGKYSEAEPLLQHALRISEQHFEPMHPLVAYPLNGLADLYREQGKYAEAEPLLQRTLHIREQALGPMHPDVAYALNTLASLYREQGKYSEAKQHFQRTLHIREQVLGPMHPETAEVIHNLAQLQEAQGNSDEARACYVRALAVYEQALGVHHFRTMETRSHLIALLHTMGQQEEANLLEASQSEQ